MNLSTVHLKMNSQEIGCPDSLKKRYVFKLSTNLIGFLISLITSVLIPRGLGPKAFGDFNFLTNFFSQLMSFFDMGTSTAYYTKLSQRPRDTDLVRFYLLFAIFISLVILLFVFLTHWRAMDTVIWPGQETFIIYLAAGLGIITWSSGILNQMADAFGLTVPAEKVRIGQKIIGLLLIAALFFGHLFQLTNYFFYNYLMVLLLSGAFITIMTKNNCFSIDQNWLLPWHKIRIYLKEFYKYCHPLFVLSLIGFIANIFDRWLLQFFGGSIQQGFYGLSYQIGTLCFLFTGAMTPLLMREFSIAYQHHDLDKMANLFRRYVPLLYSIAAFIACFIAIQADKVIYIMGGKAYNDALLSVTIMSFYPLHQTYGQLIGSVFYATGDTRIYRNLGVVFLLAGIPLTYFLIAPADKWDWIPEQPAWP
jgi:O-antigen/teichoic acid export membrane protein